MNIFDKVEISTPIDRQAGLSSGRGFVYAPDKKVVVVEWEIQPALKRPAAGQPDLTGRRQGRLVVVGLVAGKASAKNTKPTWACRCACGRYTSRTARSVCNPNNTDDRCSQCLHVKFLQRESKRLATPTPAPRAED